MNNPVTTVDPFVPDKIPSRIDGMSRDNSTETLDMPMRDRKSVGRHERITLLGAPTRPSNQLLFYPSATLTFLSSLFY